MARLLLILVHVVSWFYLSCNCLYFANKVPDAKDDIFSGNPCKKPTTALTSSDIYYVSARYYSYCTEKCLKACNMPSVKTSYDCYLKCTGNDSMACLDGCKFYAGIVKRVTSGNITNVFPPSKSVIYPLISDIGHEKMKLKWNASISSSPVFYIIYAYNPVQNLPGGRNRRMTGMNMPPINITIFTQRLITRALICKMFPSNNHVAGLKFEYEIGSISSRGWVSNDNTQQSNALSQASFTPAANVLNLTTVGQPFLTQSIALFYVINYNVEWLNVAGSKVTHYLATYDGNNCKYYNTLSPKVVASGSKKTTIQVHPPVLDKQPCDIVLIVTSMVGCLVGKSSKLKVAYKGCQMFPNAPSQCNASQTTLAPVTIPTIIATKMNEQFLCENEVNSSCVNGLKTVSCKLCTVGSYNVTMSWKKPTVPNSVNILYYECRIFEYRKTIGQYVPVPRVPTWTIKQTSTFVANLRPDFEYQFKVAVYISSNPNYFPRWHQLQGLKFKTNVIPVPTFEPQKTTPKTAIKPTEKTATSNTRINTHIIKNDNTIGLAAGLGTALFVVLVGGIMFILFERKRRKRKDKKKTFDMTEFSCAHYQATPPIDDWEIPIQNIVFGEAIGEGAFGKVFTATVKGVTLNYSLNKADPRNSSSEVVFKNSSSKQTGITMKAAVKILQDGAGEQQRSEFLEEIKLMKEVGQHKNIVSMLACVTQSFPLCLIVEFMPFGDLLHYLRGRRSKILSQPALYANEQFYALKYIADGEVNNKSTENLMPYINNDEPNDVKNDANTLQAPKEMSKKNVTSNSDQNDEEDIAPEDLLTFSWQIASGMEFLAKKGFVHRDLAARNVLVGPNKSCKISDFGLSRLVYEEKVYMGKRSRKLPIKWMSIEAIIDQVFTTYSDVWSFGILLFEIVTLGGTPYPTLTSQALLRSLKTGYRMEKPETCSDELYNVMMACWLENPTSRPTFTDIKERLETLISEGTPYLEFDYDDSKPYYNVPSFRSIEGSGDDDDSEYDEDEADDTTMRFTSLDRRANGIENGCSSDLACKGINDGNLHLPVDQDKEERYAWSSKLINAKIDDATK